MFVLFGSSDLFSSGFVCLSDSVLFGSPLFFRLFFYLSLVPSGNVRFCFIWFWLNIFFHFCSVWFCYGLFDTFLLCPVWFLLNAFLFKHLNLFLNRSPCFTHNDHTLPKTASRWAIESDRVCGFLGRRGLTQQQSVWAGGLQNRQTAH